MFWIERVKLNYSYETRVGGRVMAKKKIYYPYPRRKWENDIINCEFQLFDLVPKAEISHDEQRIPNDKTIKERLKKYNGIKNLIKLKNYLKLKYDKYIPKFRVEKIGKYDGIITTQLFFKNSQYNKKPYICYVENSHSVLGYDYSKYVKQKYSKKIKNELLKCIDDEYFRGFVFYSYRSKKGFYQYFNEVIDNNYKFLDVIYPYVKDNMLINKEVILGKSRSIDKRTIELLYISSMFSLKGGCEIIEAFKKLDQKYNIKLNIVTRIDSIPRKYKDMINNSNNIILIENKLNNNELQQLFYKSHILLHPTFMDSTAIVVMEALKSGLPVIATDTFAIPEYIEHGKNGYLIENPIKYWDLNLKIQEPNEFFGSKNTASLIDSYKSNTLYNYFIDDICCYCEKIIADYENFSINAYNSSFNSEFSEKLIYDKWEKVINENLII